MSEFTREKSNDTTVQMVCLSQRDVRSKDDLIAITDGMNYWSGPCDRDVRMICFKQCLEKVLLRCKDGEKQVRLNKDASEGRDEDKIAERD